MKKSRIGSWFLKIVSLAFAQSSHAMKGDDFEEDVRHPLPLRVWLVIGAVGFLAVATITVGAVLYLMLSGPRMRIQPSYLPYQMQAPPTPPGTVAVSPLTPARFPPADQLRNPLPDTAATRETGRIYYGYYCAFCHGYPGTRMGPVGLSYVPAPPSLAQSRIQKMPDGVLYRAMLMGAGHEPVLEYVTDEQARWYIVNYVRSFGKNP